MIFIPFRAPTFPLPVSFTPPVKIVRHDLRALICIQKIHSMANNLFKLMANNNYYFTIINHCKCQQKEINEEQNEEEEEGQEEKSGGGEEEELK